MTINFICDYCDWVGELGNYYAHLDESPKCDTREQCCKSKSVKDYDDLEPDEICDSCLNDLQNYYEDFWADIAMGER